MKRWMLPLILASLAACAEPAPQPAAPVEAEPKLCPADVQECADGSFVARDPENNCQFKPCPAPTVGDAK